MFTGEAVVTGSNSLSVSRVDKSWSMPTALLLMLELSSAPESVHRDEIVW